MRIILISISVATLIIGIYETMVGGIGYGYPFFMLTAGLIIGVRILAMKEDKPEQKKAKKESHPVQKKGKGKQ